MKRTSPTFTPGPVPTAEVHRDNCMSEDAISSSVRAVVGKQSLVTVRTTESSGGVPKKGNQARRAPPAARHGERRLGRMLDIPTRFPIVRREHARQTSRPSSRLRADDVDGRPDANRTLAAELGPETQQVWDCDTVDDLPGLVVERENVKQGRGAVRWRNHPAGDRLLRARTSRKTGAGSICSASGFTTPSRCRPGS